MTALHALADKSSEANAFNTVRVFSATMARNRDDLGERVTAWIREHPGATIVDTVVVQSSDEAFHCLTFVVFARDL